MVPPFIHPRPWNLHRPDPGTEPGQPITRAAQETFLYHPTFSPVRLNRRYLRPTRLSTEFDEFDSDARILDGLLNWRIPLPRHVGVEIKRAGSKVAILVCSKDSGITPEHSKQSFDRFFTFHPRGGEGRAQRASAVHREDDRGEPFWSGRLRLQAHGGLAERWHCLPFH
jgi:hypothetical protein